MKITNELGKDDGDNSDTNKNCIVWQCTVHISDASLFFFFQ